MKGLAEVTKISNSSSEIITDVISGKGGHLVMQQFTLFILYSLTGLCRFLFSMACPEQVCHF